MSATRAVTGLSPALAPRALGWFAVVALADVAATGLVAGARPVFLVAGAAAGALLGVLAPEAILALYLVAGGIKAAPWLSGLPVDLTLFAACGVVAAVGARVATGRLLSAEIPAAALLVLVLGGIVTASALWSPDPGAGLVKAIEFETRTLLAFSAPLLLIDSRRALRRLAVALVALSVILAATAVRGPDIQTPTVVAGGNEIELGMYAGFGALLALWLATRPAGTLSVLWLATSGYLAASAVAAGSRGALVGTALALLFFVAALWRGGDRRARLVAGVTLALVVALGAATVSGLVGQPALGKYEQSLTGTSTLLGTRDYLFEQGWHLALNHPLGLGGGGYAAVTGFNYPHNIALELVDEHGILALAAFVAIVVSAWRSRSAGRPSSEAALAGALLLLFLTVATSSLDLNQNRLLWFSLGLALAVPRIVRR